MVEDKNVGRKDDGDKLRYDLIPLDAEEQVVRALMFGATKYGDENWRKVPDPQRRYWAAAMRHLKLWKKGELLAQDSGLPHLAHAVCSLLFLLEGFTEAPAVREAPVVHEALEPWTCRGCGLARVMCRCAK